MKTSLKALLTSLMVCIVLLALAAANTRSFIINGKVKSEKTVDIAELQQLTLHTIGSVNIVNHKGDLKGKAKDLKGVLLRDVLQKVTLDTDNPKEYSEDYFVCRAQDGYKVVYSWNELFNTNIGNAVYLVLEREGKNLIDSDDSLLMVCTEDLRTGRRYLKNLASITVSRAE